MSVTRETSQQLISDLSVIDEFVNKLVMLDLKSSLEVISFLRSLGHFSSQESVGAEVGGKVG